MLGADTREEGLSARSRRSRYAAKARCAVISAALFAASCGGGSSSAPPQIASVLRDVAYAAREDGPLLSDVYLPADPNGAAVILIHGGGWVTGSRGDFSGLAQALSDSGFVAVVPEYRLVRDSASMFPAALDDVQLAVRWMRSNSEPFRFDPERVGAVGSSSGGQLAALLGTTDTRDPVMHPQFGSRVSCVAAFSAPFDLTANLSADLEGLIRTYVTPLLSADASPIFHVDEHAAEFLLFHGTDDELIPAAQSEAFLDELRASGVNADLMLLPGDGHEITSTESLRRIGEGTLAFLQRCLDAD